MCGQIDAEKREKDGSEAVGPNAIAVGVGAEFAGSAMKVTASHAAGQQRRASKRANDRG